jgi:hypothetical protein
MSDIKIIISEQGEIELERLQFDIVNTVQRILTNIPTQDIKGISNIFITDLPFKIKNDKTSTHAAYFEKFNDRPAYIEIYLKNIYSHIKSTESFLMMLPIQEYGLAIALFHEIGHHIRINRTHNIGKDKSEKYAALYAKEQERKYVANNKFNIMSCLENMSIMAKQGKLSSEIVGKIIDGWQKKCRELNGNNGDVVIN